VSSLTAMDKQVLLLVVAVVALTAGLLQVTDAADDIACYECTDDPNAWYATYDPSCGAYDYIGHTETQNGHDTCYIQLGNDGYIRRTVANNGFKDGQCFYDSYSTGCFCKGDHCNTNSYCSQCGYPKPTPTTMEPTTVATSNPPSPTTVATTTSEPPASLSCYNCVGCSSVEEGATSVIEDEFISCMTTVFLDSALVIRGGGYEEHPDGECVGHKEALECWCDKDLCNDDQIYV
ncbi:unnamed protein product, partial [Meganyctiphanes norvegica]